MTVPILYPHAGNRLPRGTQAHQVMTVDGVQLRAMTAGTATAKGTVVILGGRADFLERYFETCDDLIGRGFVVASFDWRGQGGSQRLGRDRLRGYVPSFRKYDEDLRAVMTQLVLVRCPAPYYALGHSTGGHIVLRSLREPTFFAKAVLTSPLLDFNYQNWPKLLAKGLAAIAVYSGLGRMFLPGYKRGPFTRSEFPRNPLTSDRERWDRDITTLEGHPELGVGGPTFSWFRAALASIRRLKSWPRGKLISCPVLLVSGTQEHVVDPQASRAFSEHVPGVSFIQIRGALHEILMEQDKYRQEFWAAFDSFVCS